MTESTTEQHMDILTDMRKGLYEAFTTAKNRSKNSNAPYAAKIESEKSMALLADALVQVIGKIEEKQNPAQGHRIVKRDTANKR